MPAVDALLRVSNLFRWNFKCEGNRVMNTCPQDALQLLLFGAMQQGWLPQDNAPPQVNMLFEQLLEASSATEVNNARFQFMKGCGLIRAGSRDHDVHGAPLDGTLPLKLFGVWHNEETRCTNLDCARGGKGTELSKKFALSIRLREDLDMKDWTFITKEPHAMPTLCDDGDGNFTEATNPGCRGTCVTKREVTVCAPILVIELSETKVPLRIPRRMRSNIDSCEVGQCMWRMIGFIAMNEEGNHFCCAVRLRSSNKGHHPCFIVCDPLSRKSEQCNIDELPTHFPGFRLVTSFFARDLESLKGRMAFAKLKGWMLPNSLVKITDVKMGTCPENDEVQVTWWDTRDACKPSHRGPWREADQAAHPPSWESFMTITHLLAEADVEQQRGEDFPHTTMLIVTNISLCKRLDAGSDSARSPVVCAVGTANDDSKTCRGCLRPFCSNRHRWEVVLLDELHDDRCPGVNPFIRTEKGRAHASPGSTPCITHVIFASVLTRCISC